jgi:ABC-type lipoprotein export system ATPase subunit
MVTHERDVSRIADRVITLADGRLVDNVRMGPATTPRVRELHYA